MDGSDAGGQGHTATTRPTIAEKRVHASEPLELKVESTPSTVTALLADAVTVELCCMRDECEQQHDAAPISEFIENTSLVSEFRSQPASVPVRLNVYELTGWTRSLNDGLVAMGCGGLFHVAST